MLNRTPLIVLAAALAGLAATSAHANLIINGDFQTGGIAPGSSTYTRDNTMYPEATWNIVSFDTIHTSWVDYYDHTLGNADGRFMIVNGETQADGYAYRQIVDTGIAPNTDYDLSGWFASLYPASVATLQFKVYDVGNEQYIASYDFTAPSALATWEQDGFTFNSGNADRLAIEVWDTNLVASGNDYSIDDLSLSPSAVPEPASMGALAPAALLLARRRR